MAIYVERGTDISIGRNSSVTPTRAVTKTNAFVIVDSSSSDTTSQGPGRWAIKGYINDNGDIAFVKGLDTTATGIVTVFNADNFSRARAVRLIEVQSSRRAA